MKHLLAFTIAICCIQGLSSNAHAQCLFHDYTPTPPAQVFYMPGSSYAGPPTFVENGIFSGINWFDLLFGGLQLNLGGDKKLDLNRTNSADLTELKSTMTRIEGKFDTLEQLVSERVKKNKEDIAALTKETHAGFNALDAKILELTPRIQENGELVESHRDALVGILGLLDKELTHPTHFVSKDLKSNQLYVPDPANPGNYKLNTALTNPGTANTPVLKAKQPVRLVRYVLNSDKTWGGLVAIRDLEGEYRFIKLTDLTAINK